MPLTLSGNGTISDLASAPTVGGTALPTNSDLPTLSTLGISNHDDITVDSSGRMTNSSQPSVYAHLTSVTSVSNNNQIIFDYARHNIGSHYNTSTGQFTAPISGRYLIMASFLKNSSDTTANVLNINVSVNGTDIGNSVYVDNNYAGMSGYLQCHVYSVLSVSQNDSIQLTNRSGITRTFFGNTAGGSNNQTYLSIHLLG